MLKARLDVGVAIVLAGRIHAVSCGGKGIGLYVSTRT